MIVQDVAEVYRLSQDRLDNNIAEKVFFEES